MERQPKQRPGAENIFTTFPAINGYVARMMLWPVEAWLHLQSEMLNAAAPATAQWMERRREGTTAALASIERLTKCQDVQDATEVQNEWVKDEAKRLEADMRSFGEQTLFFARAAEKASRQATQAAAGSAE